MADVLSFGTQTKLDLVCISEDCEITSVFDCDFFSEKSLFYLKKLVFIYLDNFFKRIKILKKFVFNFFYKSLKE